jgi:anti-sigma factor RsiW
MTFLTSIGAKIGFYAAIGAVLVGAWLYVGKLNADLSAEKSANAVLLATNQADVAEMAKAQAQVAQADAAEAALQAVSAQHAKFSGLAQVKGNDATDAPIVSDYFASLRGSK